MSGSQGTGYRALVAGATGATGRELVAELLRDPTCREVTALSRNVPSNLAETFPSMDPALAVGRLTLKAVDWEAMSRDPSPYLAIFQGQHFVAMCMGTTRKDAGSAEAFRRVDLEYVTVFANAVKTMGMGSLQHYSQVSSTGANKDSWFLYMKTKGEADEMAVKCKFPRLTVFRPGLLFREDKARWVEKVGAWCTSAMPVKTLAAAMLADYHQAVQEGRDDGRPRYLGNTEIYVVTKNYKGKTEK